ncbi:MAG: hypothetical protein FWD34_08195 [Oscillospiraceae bacterium]|nr:hypothetical protein [Oscillospiraceae bacterium]
MIELPKQVLEVTEKLGEYGYTAYIYGECVRLLIKGQTLLDFDVVVSAEMSRIRSIFEGYTVNEDNLDKNQLLIRVLGVAVTVKSNKDIPAELKNCAFTFDSVAYNPEKGFIDPFSGMKHIEENLIKFIDTDNINPHDILPALGWYSEGEYEMHETAKEAILNRCDTVRTIPPELLREDFERILMGKKAGTVLGEYETVITAAIPELNMLKFDEALSAHTFKSINNSSPILVLRYALFFHKFGKPDCYSKDADEIAHYHGFIERSRIYTERIMTRLGCDKADIKEACYIIENHTEIVNAEFNEVADLFEAYPADLLKLLFLFNCAIFRADGNENEAARYKKMSSLIN